MIPFLKKTIQIVYCIYALVVFIAIMFVAFPFIIIASFFGINGGNFIYKVCKIWASTWYMLVGIRHLEYFESPHDTMKQYIFVANHISYLDIPPIVITAKQPIRVLGKYEMVKFPIFGSIYRAAVILVDRRDAERRSKSVRQLKLAVNQGLSIFIFPEGTFNETDQTLKEFFDGAFRIAIETQTPIKPMLFIDTLDRLHYRGLFELTPGKNRVVYLQEVPVIGLTMAELPQLKQQVYNMMEDGLNRYKKQTNDASLQMS
jgi:1-acyl-sn-glycerol-3-phosphate acyltransferase